MDSAVRTGMTIQATDGAAGQINDILLDREGGQPRYLVVQGQGFFGHDVVVPASAISHVAGDRVFVGMSLDDVRHRPRYEPDQFGGAQGLVSQTAATYDRHHDEEQR
jgi:hypothetical protein